MKRDAELQLLLSHLRNVKPSQKQLAKWDEAVQLELLKVAVRKRPRFGWTAQLAAVLATGFLLGFLSSRHLPWDQENNEPVATTQYIFSKSE